MKYRVIEAAFETLSRSGAAGLVRRLGRCKGVIFTLHRVLPDPPAAFAPNAILQVTPGFLERVIMRARELGLEPVSLDEAIARIESDDETRPFAVFTFDDAYRDNLEHALPVLREQACPFTLYVPTAFVDGAGELWWQALEDIIAANEKVSVSGTDTATITREDKVEAYNALYWRMRDMPEHERVAFIRAFAADHRYDLARQCRDLIMNWHELRIFADDPLCTIGAHTVHHYELAKLPEDEARAEIVDSAAMLEKRLGARPRHLSFPIGAVRAAGRREYALAEELGFRSAVTTLPGGLYARHRDKLTALPRISLNGLYQNPAYIDVFLTGALFSLLGRA